MLVFSQWKRAMSGCVSVAAELLQPKSTTLVVNLRIITSKLLFCLHTKVVAVPPINSFFAHINQNSIQYFSHFKNQKEGIKQISSSVRRAMPPSLASGDTQKGDLNLKITERE